MKLNHKNDNLIKSIPLMALMAAINVIFVLITTLVPVLLFLIVFVLPLTSVLVTLKCPKRYFFIYAISTILLCLGITFWCIDDTIFYVIPSIISGFLFGLFIEKKVPIVYVVIITTFAQMLCSYASIPLIQLITNRNIITVFATALNIQDFAYLDYLVPVFIFFISMVQEIISFLVIKDEIIKFGYSFSNQNTPLLPLFLTNLALLSMMIAFAFIYGPIAFLLLEIALVVGVFIFIELIKEKSIFIYVCFLVSLLLTFFLFGVFYPLLPVPLGFLLIGIILLFELIIVLINNCLLKRNNKDTI